MKPIMQTKPTVLDPTACPTCRTPLDALAYCPRDGAIGRDGRFTVGAHYVVDELLGAGERSFVYAGRRGDTQVAIKLLRDADTSASSPAVRRFLREARNASQLVHDHTVATREFGYDDKLGAPFIAMELFVGQSLERVLRTSGPMAMSRAIPILVQVARSLGNAHMAGVLHREVGSRSVLVARGDVVTLGDYGLGRGDDASGSEGDMFGLGSTGVEMLLGRAPASPLAMLDKVPADVSLELRTLLAQCLDASASARPRAPEIEARLLAIAAKPAAAALAMPAQVATPAPAPVAVTPAAAPVAVEPVAPEPVAVAPTPEPVAVAPTPEPVAVAPAPEPVAVVAATEPAAPTPEPEAPAATAADSLDTLPAELPVEDDAYEPAPRRRWPWLAAGGAVVAAALVAIVVHVTGGSDASPTSTPPPTPTAAAPVIAPPPPAPAAEPTPAPTPSPPTPAPEPVEAAATTPTTPTPPLATPTPAPPLAVAPATTAAVAPTAKKKPKHRDDAVIVNPFSE
jgi:predicted Ser/Thr protein kinase